MIFDNRGDNLKRLGAHLRLKASRTWQDLVPRRHGRCTIKPPTVVRCIGGTHVNMAPLTSFLSKVISTLLTTSLKCTPPPPTSLDTHHPRSHPQHAAPNDHQMRTAHVFSTKDYLMSILGMFLRQQLPWDMSNASRE